MTRAEVLAERLHVEHMREFTRFAEEGDNFAADQCGNCQRWARYALAAQEGGRGKFAFLSEPVCPFCGGYLIWDGDQEALRQHMRDHVANEDADRIEAQP